MQPPELNRGQFLGALSSQATTGIRLAWSTLRLPEPMRVGDDMPRTLPSADTRAFIGSNPPDRKPRSQGRGWACSLARYGLFQVAAEVLENFLLALLNFEQDRFCHSCIVLLRMDLTRLQEDSAEVPNALLREQHLIVSLNHGSSSSTIPRFRKLREV